MDDKTQLLTQRGRERLMDFSILTNKRYKPNWHHEIIADKLEKVEQGEIKRLMLFLPPRFGKSQLATINFPAWYLGRHPDKEIITASYSGELAESFGGKTRDLVQSEHYRLMFPELNLRTDVKSKSNWMTDKNGMYLSVGIGGGITGRGSNVFIIDDPIKNREEAESPTFREKTWDWYRSVAYTRLEKDGAVVLILCMTGDTKVMMADKTEKKLCDIRVGDKVLTYNNGKLTVSTVKNWRSNGRDSVLKITTSCSKIVRANKRHPFLTYYNKKLEWTQVKNLTTTHKIVTLKDSGENGKENPVLSAINQQNAEDIACRTTVKKCGPMDIVRHLLIKLLALLQKLNTDTGLLLMSLMRLMNGKAASVPSANNCQAIISAPIGVENSALTTITKQEKSGRCSVTTATSQSHTQKPLKLPPQLQNTSDFILEDIVSIEDDGIKEVFDLQVDGTENFIANGIVSHNTRWHFDDLAGRLLEAMREDGDKWEIVSFPAIAEEDEDFRKKGESLWPAKYDLDALEQKKRVVGLMEWSAVYQQTPLISEIQEFKDNYFRYFEESDLDKKNLFIDILIDPAVSQKDTACNTGIIVAAHETTDTKIWVLDDLSGKYDPYEITELIFTKVEELERAYSMSHVRVWIETEAMQKVFTYVFHKEMKVRRKFFTLNELKSGHSENAKDIRIRGLIPLYRGGQVFHRPRMKKSELELELTQFPVGRLKDRIDALSYKVQLLRPPVLKKKKHAPAVAVNSLTGW